MGRDPEQTKRCLEASAITSPIGARAAIKQGPEWPPGRGAGGDQFGHDAASWLGGRGRQPTRRAQAASWAGGHGR